MKRPHNGSLEVEQLTLLEYKDGKKPNERLLKMKLLCEGRTAEFVYDRVQNNPILLQTIAQRILESTGANFNHRTIGDSKIVIQTNYPSLKNLLGDYLVKGGWIPPEEAERIEVIGYHSRQQSNIEEAFGLEELKESLNNKRRSQKKGQKTRTPRKKSHSFRPRRRRYI